MPPRTTLALVEPPPALPAIESPLTDPLVRVLDRLERALEAHGLNVWVYNPDPTRVRLIVDSRISVTIARRHEKGHTLPSICVVYRLGGRSYFHEANWGDPLRFFDTNLVATAIAQHARGQ